MTQPTGLLKISGVDVFPYPVEYSALFDGIGDSLSRTPSSVGDEKTWTFRTRLKLAETDQPANGPALLCVHTDADNRTMLFLESNILRFIVRVGGSNVVNISTDVLLADPTGWGDLCVRHDSTGAVAADRYVVEWNGVAVPLATATAVPLNQDSLVNDTRPHSIGKYVYSGELYGGYLADTYLIDGRALPASTWGEFSDEVTGLWVPKDPGALDFGVNGFRLYFGNGSDLGADSAFRSFDNMAPDHDFSEGPSGGWWTDGYVSYSSGTATLSYVGERAYLALDHSRGLPGSGAVVVEIIVESLSGSPLYRHYYDGGSTDTALTVGVNRILTQNLDAVSNIQLRTPLSGDSVTASEFSIYEVPDSYSGPNDWTVNGSPVQTLDSPTNNYCVLNGLDPNAGTLGNGNLTLADGTAKPTLQPESGQWYYEKDGVGVSYDADVSGRFEPDLTAGTYNFGATAWNDSGPTGGEKPLCAVNLPAPSIRKSAAVADIVLREGIGDGEQISGSTAAADSSYSTQTAAKAVDDNAGTFWQSDGTAFPHWLQVDLGSAAQLETYDITARADAQLLRTPSAWVFQGSNNASDWTALDTRAAEAFTSLGQKRSFTIASPGSYRYYRIHITANQGSGDNYTAIAEVKGQLAPVAVDSLLFQPDFVNIKNRDNTDNWTLTDAVNGATKLLSTNTTNALWTNVEALTSFDADGYSLGSAGYVNRVSESYLDLCLKAGVSQGFEIVTYNGDGTTNQLVAHSLGRAPTMMIIKRLDAASDWLVYHAHLATPGFDALCLNLSSAAGYDGTNWFGTPPAASAFRVGAKMNVGGASYIAYLFTDSDIFRAFSYTGNGSTDGPFVHLGGRPLAIPFLKNADAVGGWYNYDSVRNPHNGVDLYLEASSTAAEATYHQWDFTSVGAKVKGNVATVNGSGNVIIGLAVLASAGKYANAF